MNIAGQSWRAAVAALDARVTTLDGERLREAASMIEGIASRARDRAVDAAVLDAIRRAPGASSNALVLASRADRARTLRRLRELARAGRARYEPGPKGARLWFAEKDRSRAANRST